MSPGGGRHRSAVAAARLERQLDDLQEVSSRLSGAGVHHALGGSGLLCCLGFDVRPADWDLLTDADEPAVVRALAGWPLQRKGPTERFPSDYLLTVPARAGRIEIIGNFRIATPRGPVAIPTRVAGRFRGIPLGHPEDWLRAYRAMAETDAAQTRDDRGKIAMLKRHLASQDLPM